MKFSITSLECLLEFFLLRLEKLKLSLQKVENEIAVLRQLILETKRAEVQKEPTVSQQQQQQQQQQQNVAQQNVVQQQQTISQHQQQPAVPQSLSDEITRPVRVRRVIEALDVHRFLHRASCFLDYLQSHFHIYIKYAWFCQFICLRYSLKRQRGGVPGSDLSPTTVLSYFKKERAGEY